MKKHGDEFLALVNEAKFRVKEVSIEQVNDLLQNKDVVIIDVREDHEWQQGHLPGAKHLGKGIIERDIEKTVSDKSQQLVLYCSGGFRSVLAADQIQKMGYCNVVSMTGGLTAWRSAGFDVSC